MALVNITLILIFFWCFLEQPSASNFILIEDFATCLEAAIQCENRGMTLASIHNAIENQEAANLCPDTTLCIIGAVRERKEKEFRWIDGTPWDFVPPWNGENPDVPTDKVTCILIYADTTWADYIAESTGSASIICRNSSVSLSVSTSNGAVSADQSTTKEAVLIATADNSSVSLSVPNSNEAVLTETADNSSVSSSVPNSIGAVTTREAVSLPVSASKSTTKEAVLIETEDNCPDQFNPDQSDVDNDGIGDWCDFPSDCNDECDAFAVILDQIEKNTDVLCLTYSVKRLFDYGACKQSVNRITLKLCNNDYIRDCNYNDLNGVIVSIHSSKFPKIEVLGQESGIMVDFKGKVSIETSFIICLQNVFKNIEDGEYSNNVQLKRGRNTYSCNQPYLVGLPCLECHSTGSSNGGTYGRSGSNTDEIDDGSPLNIMSNIDKTVKWTVLSILVIFIILMIIAGYICIFRRKQKREKVADHDTNEDNVNNITSVNVPITSLMSDSGIE